ncbi:hypothetical protein FHU30_002289 [Actinomadura rupiterrae]|nr:hypothetical protein [Actinomadura rupiterrae]
MIDLRKASAAVHARALRLESLRVGVSATLAIAGVLAAFVQIIMPPIAAMGALWALVLAVGVNPWVRGLAKRAATLQEMFDVELFGLPWNKTICGSTPARYECNRWTRKFSTRRGGVERLRDWYVDVGSIPQPYDILFCQLQNLAWDSRLRRRWARTVLALVIVWVGLGALVGYLASLTIKETLVSWYLPAMGAFLLGFDNYRGQLEIASERERLTQIVQAELDGARRPPLSKKESLRLSQVMREIQDAIFSTRKHTARVPDWFYRRFRGSDQRDFQLGADVLRGKLVGP